MSKPSTFTVTLDVTFTASGSGVSSLEQIIADLLERYPWVQEVRIADISVEVTSV